LIFAIIAVFATTLEAAPLISEAAAREHMKQGAMLVDVRTVREFEARHLTNAVNIPLAELKEKVPDRVPDKHRVLLLYCRSGRRSGIAEGHLRNMGYTNVFNLGSYGRAQGIVNGQAN